MKKLYIIILTFLFCINSSLNFGKEKGDMTAPNDQWVYGVFKVYKNFLLFVVITVFLCISASIVWGKSKVDFVEIKLLDNLDDERGYCIDIKGYKLKAKINRGLQAHTCYSYQGEVAVDQGLDANRFKYKELFFPKFDVCISLTSSKKSNILNLIKCDDTEKFVFSADDTIRLKKNMNLCLTVAKGNSRKGRSGSPLHLIRKLSLKICDKQNFIYQTWGVRRFIEGKIFEEKISKSS